MISILAHYRLLAVLLFSCLAAIAVKAATPAISAGYGHSLFLKPDGSAWATGSNSSGQLGDGGTTDRSTPVQVMSGVRAISARFDQSLWLKDDGSVWAAGLNSSGQLGDGTTTNRSTPVQVMTNVQAVSAGGTHSLFLKADGSVWASGSNGNGQLGDGTTTNHRTPVQVMTGVQAISTGYQHSLFLKTDGSVWAAGYNASGQLGDSTTTSRSTPVQIMTGVKAISAGSSYSLYLKTDGSVWATGYNFDGQLGDGTTTDRSTPVQVMTGVQAISASDFHSLFLKPDGSVWATGNNSYGQLGDGTKTNRSKPFQVMTGVQAISAGYYHSLFLKTDGSVLAAGKNEFGQLGDGTTTNRSTPVRTIQLFQLPDIALEAPTGTPVTNGNSLMVFSSTAPGQASDQTVTIRNTGNGELNSIAAAITGPDAGQFSVVSSSPVTLVAGASAAFTMRFSPTSPGSKNATLSVASNDPDENPFTLALTGMGTSSGGSDIIRPAMGNFSLTPNSVDATAAAQTVTATVRLTDDLSGVDHSWINFYSPSQNQYAQVYIGVGNRISGTALDGNYRTTFTIPRYAEGGDWKLQEVYIYDVIGNLQSYYPSSANPRAPNLVFPVGTPEILAVTGATADTKRPEMGNFSFTPNSVNATASDQLVTATIRLTDDLSGVDHSWINFYSPSQNQYAQVYIGVGNRISGTALDGNYRTTFTIPRYAEGGDWKLQEVYIYDVIGNLQSYYPSSANPRAPNLVFPVGTPETLAVNSTVSPLVILGPSSNVTTTGATISGAINPRGDATTYSFQYGASLSYGTTTASLSAGNGTTNVPVSLTLSSLSPNQIYYFRLIAVNSFGSAYTTAGTFKTMVNSAPTFSGYVVSTAYQTPVTITKTKLVKAATDPDGNALSVFSVGVSAQGGSVVMGATTVTYTPPNGYSGPDSFPVTIQDSLGATVAGNVTVTVGANSTSGGTTLNPPVLTMEPNGSAGLSFQGIPGRTYLVQRTTNMTDWTTLATLVADASGNISYTDPPPLPSSAFYRLAKP